MDDHERQPIAPPGYRLVRIIGEVTADSFTPVEEVVAIPLELLGYGQEEP